MEKKGLLQSNKGFTLVELCVVIVLLSLLITVTTMGLLTWQEYSLNNKQEENAELVYMAVKNKMAVLMKNNALFEVRGWKSNAANDEEVQLTFDEETLMESETVTALSNGNYYMLCNKADYAKYKDKEYEGMSPNGSKTLLDFIVPYIYDKSILDACIAVEYDPNGNIISVFYSDRCSVFKYESGYSMDSTVYLTSIKKNTEKRYELMVGMYTPN